MLSYSSFSFQFSSFVLCCFASRPCDRFAIIGCSVPGAVLSGVSGSLWVSWSLPNQQIRPRFVTEHSGLLLVLARRPSEGRCGPSHASAHIVYRDYLSLLPAVLLL